jgi:hypothetical protein
MDDHESLHEATLAKLNDFNKSLEQFIPRYA